MKLEKIVEGQVRITLEKFCVVSKYVMALTTPHWNMPTLSIFDYDTLSPTITNHIVKKKYEYGLGY